ncbi:cation diffusion facilitator family transporter [Macrococcus equipercicus]|uniref:Cation transporter n=1 Tax=Macrococcus equipercicus TaxID=69967 RepID=A0A9Q9BP68_9STAP|nr:cation diffusion facilitator family transporter [Macrococcus equipercicus]UTH14130.1 cation transporter [Macrococcus equipercicus]
MAGEHNHAHTANKKALLLSFIVITAYMIVEAVGGFMTNSLALLSDAGHMLSDAISLGVGLMALVYGTKSANYTKTYGYKRFEILAAVVNGVALIGISLYILVEAVGRFQHPPAVASRGMLIIAVIGLLVNIFVAWLLMRGDTHENLNIRAAFLHVIGDLLGSVGAIIAALLIMFFNLGIADPIASIIVALLVLVSGFRVTRDAVHILMEGTPANVDIDEVISTINEVDGVIALHDLHIWSITSGQNALSCHVVVDGGMTVQESQMIQEEISHRLEHKNIGHTTIQVECTTTQHAASIICTHQEQAHSHHH